jgi:PqqD family protein of HPr-rel-A system
MMPTGPDPLAARETDAVEHVVHPEVIDCPLGDGLALFDSRSGEYYSLNGTAALMWQVARAPATRGALLDAVRRTEGAPDDDAAITRDVDTALAEFLALGLFIPASAPGTSATE